MTITVRRATAEELPEVATLFAGYLDFYQRPAPRETIVAFLRERLDRGEAIVLLARTASGEPAGFVNVYPTFSSLSMAPVWTLNDLFVAPAARRLGVGQALVRACADEARAAGAIGVQLQTAPDNTSAQALYRAEGFEPDTFSAYYLALPR
ncbi:ribosomal protein S18 acetylase RimI-like enzyme [Actinoplanes octamycinicus]|uniref:Ribosomal protein S18 acetylase RimI-like enzyme n=1 Tax=Actinoplanes octamycinicus TaxID=135948 RepID=A0A7W7MAL3_9ACTN|nr:GNAT family N-acetyltransferase [Actinoplanes octamycinicus]MBB4743178.1 ribosomal protein S18 acetylase RimI-like enzyme [Actinoplanes octamycinicus]